MNVPTPPRFRSVFLPTDLAEHDARAFAHGLRLALAQAGELTCIHVRGRTDDEPIPWDHLPSVRQLLVRWGRLGASDGVDAFHRLGMRIDYKALPSLDLTSPVTAEIRASAPDLLMLTTHARSGFQRLREESVAETIAREARVPTLFFPDHARGFVDPDSGSVSLRRVLVAAGSVTEAREGIAAALSLVSSYDAAPCEFVLVFVGDRAEVPALFLPEDDPRWTWSLDVRHGPVVTELVSAIEAHDADVLVMATHGHDSIADWLRGSTTEMVTRHAMSPVLAVPLP